MHLLNAAATFGLLVSLPLHTFVAIKTGASLAITFAGMLFTVAWAIRIARGENLVFCPGATATIARRSLALSTCTLRPSRHSRSTR